MDKTKVAIVWGEDDSTRAANKMWETMENEPVVYSFDSIAERDAFMKGVGEAIGWMEFQDLSESDYKDYKLYLRSTKRRRRAN